MHPSQHLLVRGLLRAGIVAGGGLLALAVSQTHALADSGPTTGIPITTTSCSSCLPVASAGSASLSTATQLAGGTATVGAVSGYAASGGTDAQTQTAATSGAGPQSTSQTSGQRGTGGTVDHTGSVSTPSGMATRGTDAPTTASTTITTSAHAGSGVRVPQTGQSGATPGSPPSCLCPGPTAAPPGTVSVDVEDGTPSGSSVSASTTVRTSGTAAIGGTETQTTSQTNTTTTITTNAATSGGDHPEVATGVSGDMPVQEATGGARQPAVDVTTTARTPTRPAGAAPGSCACRATGAGTPSGAVASGSPPKESEDRVAVSVTTGAARVARSTSALSVRGGPPMESQSADAASDTVVPGSAIGMAGDGSIPGSVDAGGAADDRTADRGCGCPPLRPVIGIRTGSSPPASGGVESGAPAAVSSIPCACVAAPAVLCGPGAGVGPAGSSSVSSARGQERGGLTGCDQLASLLIPPAAAPSTVIVLAGRAGGIPATSETALGTTGGRPAIGAPGGGGAAGSGLALPRLSMPWRAPPSGVTLLPITRGTSPPG